ncbi:MAG: YggS family pyridoxal phosphate-dependent enzyme [Thermoflexibacter sp.]|nr:YggS family pyridoxal phosphate-dependent enzyme [Thermoflexibacter sp.]
MSITENLKSISEELASFPKVKLIAVTKTKPIEILLEAYQAGLREFGENKVQEMLPKYEALPKDIHWHLIGHLQTNKVKYIAPFVYMIHSVDSLKLLQEIDKQGKKSNKIINCLLQIYIATEESKFGLDEQELTELLENQDFKMLKNIKIKGVMGMATNTENTELISQEFGNLKNIFEKIRQQYQGENIDFQEISMGMSGDYSLAIEQGSTMVRIGSKIFGSR